MVCYLSNLNVECVYIYIMAEALAEDLAKMSEDEAAPMIEELGERGFLVGTLEDMRAMSNDELEALIDANPTLVEDVKSLMKMDEAGAGAAGDAKKPPEKTPKGLADNIKAKHPEAVKKVEDAMSNAIKDEGGWFKSMKKNPLQTFFVAFIGGEVLVQMTMQTEEECEDNCEARKNKPVKDCPDVPTANCPENETDDDKCETYCEDACSQENRVDRAVCKIKNDPVGAVAGAAGKFFRAPLNIWEHFRYEIIGFVILVAGFLFYKYTTSWAVSAGEALTLTGKKRGTRITKDLSNVVHPFTK
jgi:hypothetical protein